MDSTVAVLGIAQVFHQGLHAVEAVGPVAVSVRPALEIHEAFHVCDDLVEGPEFHRLSFYSNGHKLSTWHIYCICSRSLLF